jgi:hypothetical protein
MHNMLDLYTDFLIACPGQASATFMSSVTEGAVSHDQITRMLSGFKSDSKALWKMVKPLCYEMRSNDAVLVLDDSIQPKPHSKPGNGLISYHFDHTKGKAVKGINFITALYHTGGMSIPIGAEFVIKDKPCIDKDGKVKMKATISKNEHFRHLVAHGTDNVAVRYVLADSWYANAANMRFVKEEAHTDFVMALKENRKVALSLEDKQAGRYQPIKEMTPEGGICIVWIEQLDFPLLITRQVFKNGDGTCGILYLGSSDLNLDATQLSTIYQRRWKVEEFHKAVKGVNCFGGSPAWKAHTQTAHLYASIMAFVKVEVLKQRRGKNHFAIKAMIFKKATQAAWKELDRLSLKKTG